MQCFSLAGGDEVGRGRGRVGRGGRGGTDIHSTSTLSLHPPHLSASSFDRDSHPCVRSRSLRHLPVIATPPMGFSHPGAPSSIVVPSSSARPPQTTVKQYLTCFSLIADMSIDPPLGEFECLLEVNALTVRGTE